MEDITLEGLLRQYITSTINGLFTAIPAKVVGTVDLAEQRIDVQIVVNKITTDEQSRHHPVVLGVPLIFQGSRTSQFSFPVQVGDTVLCIFSQRSIDRFKLGANDVHAPMDFRKYSRADAMAIPGLFTFPDAVNDPAKHSLTHSTEDAVVVHNIGTSAECEVRLKASGDVIVNAPGNKVEVNCQDSVVNASTSSTVNTQTATINASSSTLIDTPTMTVTGDMLVEGHFTYVSGMTGSGGSGDTASITGSINVTSGDVTSDGISLKSHTHTGDSGGTTSAPK